MTVAAKSATVTYTEDGASVSFPVPFRFKASADLIVERIVVGVATRLALGADYTVAGGATDAGGTVTRLAATSGAQLRIRRRTARAQPMKYATGDRFPAASHEDALDRAMLIDQEQDADVLDLASRALLMPAGEAAAPVPSAASRAGSVLGFGSLGQWLFHTGSTLATLVAPYLPPFLKGDPGGNVMAIGLFAAAATLSVPAGTDRLRTSGHTIVGRGAADYAYDATITSANVGGMAGWAFVTANGRGFRLAGDQAIDFAMFGGRPEFVSGTNRGFDNSVAFAAMRSFQIATGDTRGVYYRYTYTVYFGIGSFYFSDSIRLDYGAVHFLGAAQGTTTPYGLGGTRLVFGANKHGIIVNAYNTTGDTVRPDSPAGEGSTIEGLAVESLGGSALSCDGFRVRTACTVANCIATNFTRDGFNYLASLGSGGASEGNANSAVMSNCTAVRNYRNGFHFQGADANALALYQLNALYNGQIGINLQQFLANTLIGYHCEGNGTGDAGPRSLPQQNGAQCSFGGNRYFIQAGQAGAASAIQPGTDPKVWSSLGPGGVHPFFPLWVPGKMWVEGGPLRSMGLNAGSAIVGGYVEPGQPPSVILGPTVMLGGQQDAGVVGRANLYNRNSALASYSFEAFDGTRSAVLGGDPNSGQFLFFQGRTGFPWRMVDDPAGGIAFTWANLRAAFAIKPDTMDMTIARPVLGRLCVEGATAPVPTGAVTRHIEVFDAAGASLGVVEVKAKA